jgi:hypothetical protein
MSGRVSVRYYRAPARLQYSKGLATGTPSVVDSLDMESTSVAVG